MTSSPMLDAVIRYALDGIPVFPCRNKKPLTAHGFKDASLDAQQLLAWWTENPDAQIGIPTGSESHLFVVDVDGPEADAIVRGMNLPPTRTVETSPGRYQLWYSQPEGVTTKSTAGVIAQHVDTRGDGGYIIAPPSIHHASQKPYRFVDETAPMAAAPAP